MPVSKNWQRVRIAPFAPCDGKEVMNQGGDKYRFASTAEAGDGEPDGFVAKRRLRAFSQMIKNSCAQFDYSYSRVG